MKRTVVRADVLGFCMGVRRAMEKVEEAIEENAYSRINTFGPLIHNEQVLEELARKGVGRIDSPQEFAEGAVVIRAHGVEKRTMGELAGRGASVIDGTCPKVARSMRLVTEYASSGWNIIIVGDPGHGEVKAVSGYAHNTIVISKTEEAEKLVLNGPTMVIAQTTVEAEEYRRITEVLEKKGVTLEIIDSICSATRERQEALKELAEKVEAIVVIGGKNSSNTKRLHRRALALGKPSWHVELPEQLPEEIRNYKIVGITAGASTPDKVIDEVETYIQFLGEEE